MAATQKPSASIFIKYLCLSLLAVFMLVGNITSEPSQGISRLNVFTKAQAHEQINSDKQTASTSAIIELRNRHSLYG